MIIELFLCCTSILKGVQCCGRIVLGREIVLEAKCDVIVPENDNYRDNFSCFIFILK